MLFDSHASGKTFAASTESMQMATFLEISQQMATHSHGRPCLSTMWESG
jgi:hypothetical protein